MQHKCRLLSSFVGFSIVSSVVWAETAPSILSTITLRAQQDQENNQAAVALTKFGHDVLDVPFSRSYLSREVLRQQDIQRIDQALYLVSGVFHQNNYGGGFWDNYSFRGFASDPNLGTASIRNGLSLNRGLSAPRDMVNIESLDFLKGPAAALYGRGEMGGLLNITTKKPQWEPQSTLSLRATTNEQYRVSLENTGPVNDEFAYRFAMSREDNQSFRDHVSNERWFFSPQLSWKISEQTRLDLDSEITRQQGTFDRGISAYNGQILMNPKTFTGEPEDGDMKMNDEFYQLRLSHQLNDQWKLNSALSYKQGLMKGFSSEPKSFEPDGETLNRQRRYRDYFTKDLLAQTELLGKLESQWARHEILVSTETGQLVSDQYQLRCDYKYTGARYCISQINVYHPEYSTQLPALGLQTNTRERQHYFALNLQDQMFFNDQWSLLLGTRFDRVQQKMDDYKADHSAEKTVYQTSPRIGLNYRLNDALSFYSNYGRSFAMHSGSDRNDQMFAPEKGESYELGSKYRLNDIITASLALFHMKKRNVLTTDPVDANYQYAAGEAQSQGVELDIQGQLSDRLGLLANYTYTEAEVSKDTAIAKGSHLNNIPRHSANLGLDYTLLQEASRKAGMGASIHYIGKRNGTQSTGFELPGYTLLNLNAYYEPTDRLRYQLSINNLLDKDYYVESYSDMWIQPGDPLNAALSMQWTF